MMIQTVEKEMTAYKATATVTPHKAAAPAVYDRETIRLNHNIFTRALQLDFESLAILEYNEIQELYSPVARIPAKCKFAPKLFSCFFARRLLAQVVEKNEEEGYILLECYSGYMCLMLAVYLFADPENGDTCLQWKQLQEQKSMDVLIALKQDITRYVTNVLENTTAQATKNEEKLPETGGKYLDDDFNCDINVSPRLGLGDEFFAYAPDEEQWLFTLEDVMKSPSYDLTTNIVSLCSMWHDYEPSSLRPLARVLTPEFFTLCWNSSRSCVYTTLQLLTYVGSDVQNAHVLLPLIYLRKIPVTNRVIAFSLARMIHVLVARARLEEFSTSFPDGFLANFLAEVENCERDIATNFPIDSQLPRQAYFFQIVKEHLRDHK